ncbi:hypothetical protein [Hymenobacter mucosus]|uniref:SpoIIAA-like n=1 Tax=Hymenobacter mucosus TaxID=1411120 RepID=A0A239ABL8_9BACT|nr:hypothetical protein [Hymenobacter mucosus]SNR93025.1 hypothetical protein SAMN06269173_111137 [Hymenobacter mucosus]
MSLQLLTETSAISIYLDVDNQWLYADWHGHLTLARAQKCCTTLAYYVLQGQYTKIINDNTNVLSMSAEVSSWLANEYLPYVAVGGIKFIAWVNSPSMSAQCYTDIALGNLASPVVVRFTDTATACSWLQGAQFHSPNSIGAPVQNTHQLVELLQEHRTTAPLAEALKARLMSGSVYGQNRRNDRQ